MPPVQKVPVKSMPVFLCGADASYRGKLRLRYSVLGNVLTDIHLRYPYIEIDTYVVCHP